MKERVQKKKKRKEEEDEEGKKKLNFLFLLRSVRYSSTKITKTRRQIFGETHFYLFPIFITDSRVIKAETTRLFFHRENHFDDHTVGVSAILTSVLCTAPNDFLENLVRVQKKKITIIPK